MQIDWVEEKQPFLWGWPCSCATFSQSQHLFGHQNQPSPSQGRNPWKCAFTRAFVTADSILFLPHLNLWTKNQLQILKHLKGEASRPACAAPSKTFPVSSRTLLLTLSQGQLNPLLNLGRLDWLFFPLPPPSLHSFNLLELLSCH